MLGQTRLSAVIKILKNLLVKVQMVIVNVDITKKNCWENLVKMIIIKYIPSLRRRVMAVLKVADVPCGVSC